MIKLRPSMFAAWWAVMIAMVILWSALRNHRRAIYVPGACFAHGGMVYKTGERKDHTPIYTCLDRNSGETLGE